jgi:hypothetical protein
MKKYYNQSNSVGEKSSKVASGESALGSNGVGRRAHVWATLKPIATSWDRYYKDG